MDESTTHRKVRLHCATFDCLDVGERANERMGRRDVVRLDGHGRGGTVGGWEKTNLGDAKHVWRHTWKRDVRNVVDGRTKERTKSIVDGLETRRPSRTTSCSTLRNTPGGTPSDQHDVDAKNGVHKASDLDTKRTKRETNERSNEVDSRGPVGQGLGKGNGE